MQPSFSTGYDPRPIRSVELVAEDGWRLKVYGIAAANRSPNSNLVSAAKHVALEHLPGPAIDDDRYGVGFLIVHEGQDANFVLLDWWVGENMLHQDVFTPSFEEPARLTHLPAGPTACVWELFVLSFERQAWISTVLANPEGPDLDAYLDQRLNATV